jgi:hypothetical protein
MLFPFVFSLERARTEAKEYQLTKAGPDFPGGPEDHCVLRAWRTRDLFADRQNRANDA